MAAIDELLAGAHQQRSGVLILRGDAGIGKSAVRAGRRDLAEEVTATYAEARHAAAGHRAMAADCPVQPGSRQS